MARVLLILLFIVPTICRAAAFYIDPVNGLNTNDGTSAAPWKTVQHLLDNNMIESRQWNSLGYTSSSYLVAKNPGAPVQGGDTIYLRSGSYGELSIIHYYNSAPITIAAEAGQTPVFRNIVVRSASNWKLHGLTVDASAYPQASFSTLIDLENHGWTGPVHSVTVSGCTLFSIADASGWSREDWNVRTKNGITVEGAAMSILSNSVSNVNMGISVSASHSLIEGNSIRNFAGDGLRGLGDYCVFQYNTVKNCYDVNDNHDDGFQSWSVGSDGRVGTGTVKGIVLRGNTIINYEDPNQPFRGTLQGIGCFDGMFEGWVVEKNVIKVDHWHGISLYGAVDVTVRENIVMDLNTQRPGPPWILLHDHKNGTVSRDSSITCNIAPKILTDNGVNIDVRFNTLSETGGPKHPRCPPFANVPPLLPLLLD